MSLSVGVVGLGIMGGSFARNLLADGQTQSPLRHP